MSQVATRAKSRKGAKAGAQESDDRERCTLLLDADVSMKLSIEAHRRKADRSKTINLLLAESLRHLVISVRGTQEESARSPVEVAPPALKV